MPGRVSKWLTLGLFPRGLAYFRPDKFWLNVTTASLYIHASCSFILATSSACSSFSLSISVGCVGQRMPRPCSGRGLGIWWGGHDVSSPFFKGVNWKEGRPYHVHVDVPNLLVGTLAVVLQDVVLDGARGDGEFLGYGLGGVSLLSGVMLGLEGNIYQELGQVLVRNIRQLFAVVLGDDELRVVPRRSASGIVRL